MSDQNSASTGASSGGKTGAGAEAAEGVHASQSNNQSSQERSSLEGRTAASTNEGGAGRRGSEPLAERDHEHTPSYGGKGGGPRTSSDTRESTSKDPGTPGKG